MDRRLDGRKQAPGARGCIVEPCEGLAPGGFSHPGTASPSRTDPVRIPRSMGRFGFRTIAPMWAAKAGIKRTKPMLCIHVAQRTTV